MTLPILMLPGLNCTAELFAPQLPRLGAGRSVMIGCHTRHDEIGTLARAGVIREPA